VDPAWAGIYRVYFHSQEQLAGLAARLDIWEVEADAGYLVAPLGVQDVARLREQGTRLEPSSDHTQRWLRGPADISCYRDVGGLYAALHELTTDQPLLAEPIDYGDSWQKVHGAGGYDLLALRVTNRQVPGPKPRFILMANIHARELTTPETALYFVAYLLDEYGRDADATWIVDYTEVVLIATANPDGRQYAQECTSQRKNRNTDHGGAFCSACSLIDHQGVDLNRNNPYRWGGAGQEPCDQTYQGPTAASEPETRALNDLIRSLIRDQRPDDEFTPAPDDTVGLLISLHSYGDLILWPWGWAWDRAAPNAAQLRTLGGKLAYWNHYTPQQASQLYATTGDTADWAYGELGIPAYTFELGDGFAQDCADLPGIMTENLGALIYAAKVARRPYRTPSGPDTLALSLQPSVVARGNPVQLTATVDGTRYLPAGAWVPSGRVSASAYTLDFPPWITATTPITYFMAAGDGAFDSAVETVQANVDTEGLSTGRHILYVRGQNAAGSWGPLSALFFTVTNRPAIYLPMVPRHSPPDRR
jgi:hypothetical protein